MEKEESSNLTVYNNVDQALADANKESSDKYLNKLITLSNPVTAVFDTGLIKKELVEFKQNNGTKTSLVWRFFTTDFREFSTSNIVLVKEILTAFKDNKAMLTIGKKAATDKEGREINQLKFYLVKAEPTL